MGNNSRKKYSADFKAKVALEALKEQMTLPELEKKFGVSQYMISRWKSELSKNAYQTFKYCSKPLEAGLFEETDMPEKCDCCGKGTNLIYSGPFYSKENPDVLCPQCIASGKAAKKFHGEFVIFTF